MIRLVTLDEFDEKQLEALCKSLYQAFGVGTEHTGSVPIPHGLTEPFDAEQLLDSVKKVSAYQDDKVLYFTKRRLADRKLPSGSAPTQGYCLYAGAKALLSMHPAKDLEAAAKVVARTAMHQLGHTWELHHCLDPRCSMYLPWTPSFAQGEPIFCTFCREKSEEKIRLAKS